MFNLKLRDQKKRIIFKKIEKKLVILQFLRFNLLNKKVDVNKKYINFFYLNTSYTQKNLLNKKGKACIINRCVFTNRSRGVTQKFGISRSILSNFMHFGVIPGYKKAVW